MRILAFDVSPLSVPLEHPFVVATARVDHTRNALVHAVVVEEHDGRRGAGLGEAAALHPITAVDQPELLAHLHDAARVLVGARFCGHRDLARLLDDTLAHDPVARAGAEAALLFAWADALGVPMHTLLGSTPRNAPFHVVTDITLPLAPPAQTGALAAQWHARGFTLFKVKVGGRALSHDLASLDAIATAVPDARVLLDGNAALSVDDTLALREACGLLGLVVCAIEQPTPRHDDEALAAVTRRVAPVPVIADESCGRIDDVARLYNAGAASGVNLKLVKHGGAVAAVRIGRRALRARMSLMVGAMVETRVGLCTTLHVLRALDVDPAAVFVDLDTAFLLRDDPFVGGYDVQGARLQLRDDAPVRRRA